MFGIGVQETLLVGLLFLVIFGLSKLPGMARDLGRFVSEARRSVEALKADLAHEQEGGREPRKGRNPEINRELAENVPREEVAAIDRSTPDTE